MTELVGPKIDYAPNTGEGGGIGGPESGERDYSKATFLEARKDWRQLSAKKDTLGKKEKKRLGEVKARMDELIGEVRDVGGFVDIDDEITDCKQRVQTLLEMGKSGELKGEHKLVFSRDVRGAIRDAKEITKEEKSGVYKGVREHVLAEGLVRARKEAMEIPLPGVQQEKDQDDEGVRKLDNLRSYQDVGKDIMYFFDNPSAVNTPEGRSKTDVKGEFRELASYAKEIGVFDDVKREIEELQGKLDFTDARKEIIKLYGKMQVYEQTAKGVHGWDPKLSGIIDTYHAATVTNMNYAWEKAKGPQDNPQAERARLDRMGMYKKNAELFNYDIPPERKILNLASAQLQAEEARQQQNGELNNIIRLLLDDRLKMEPENFARAMGVASPEEMRLLYRKAEQSMMPMTINETNMPKFILTITDPVEREKAEEEWMARSLLSSSCAEKDATPVYEYLMPRKENKNDTIMSIDKEKLKVLFRKKGVYEALSLYVAIHRKDIPLTTLIDEDAPQEVRAVIDSNGDNSNTIDSWWDVNEPKKFKAARGAIKYWLRNNRGLSEEEAEDAEAIANNFRYVFHITEYFDSRKFHPDKDRLPPMSGLKHMPMWMMMHPQERLEIKTAGDEEWGAVGTWSLNNKNTKRNWSPDKFDNGRGVFPKILFRSMIHQIKVAKSDQLRRDQDLRRVRRLADSHKPENKRELYLYDILYENGKRLVDNPGTNNLVRVPWNNLGGTDISKYHFDYVGPAITVFKVIERGSGSEVNTGKLGNACRDLGLANQMRLRLLKLRVGIKSENKDIIPEMSGSGWKGYLSSIRQHYPNYFK